MRFLQNLDCDYVRSGDRYKDSETAAQAVAERAMAFMLPLSRNSRTPRRYAPRSHGQRLVEGHLLAGKVLGIVGRVTFGYLSVVLSSMIGMEIIA